VVGFEPGQQINTTLFYPSTGLATEPYSYTTVQEKVNLTTFSQHFAELSFSGDIIETWAGKIAGAFGGSYRKDEIFQRVQDVTNPTSNHVSGRPVMCNNARDQLARRECRRLRQHRGHPVLQGLQHPRQRRRVGGLRRIAGAAL
jgi:hypothetical protein